MPYRPNPFLERKLRPPSAPSPRKSWFQRTLDWFPQVRDSIALILSITSLVTALIALLNTCTGPRPFLAQLAGDSITLLRSDQFLIGPTETMGIGLRDQTGKPTDFPLLMLQPTLSNRAAAPNGIVVRAIEADLILSQQGRTVFRSSYTWYRLTTSSVTEDTKTKLDRLVFESTTQTAPFDLLGGDTWSREVLMIPRQTWSEVSWKALSDHVHESCPQPFACQGEVTLRIRLDSGVSLTDVCHFKIDEHVLAHFRGIERRYFTTPVCLTSAIE